MIDVLGFHDDRDLHAELTTIRRQINANIGRLETGAFYPEQRQNTWADLGNLRHQESVLAREAAMEDQRLERLAEAVRLVGDIELGFIAYVVFGPTALPVQPMYEIRFIEPDGIYTVPESVRTNLPAGRVEAATAKVLDTVIRSHARLYGYDVRDYRVQVTPF